MMSDLFEMWNILCERRVEAARSLSPHSECIDSLSGRRRAGRKQGSRSSSLGLDLQKLASRLGKLGGRMSISDEFWAVAHRDPDGARRRLLRSERFRAQSMAEPRPSEMRAPLEAPSDDEEPPESAADVDRFAGKLPSNHRRNDVGQRRSAKVQRGGASQFGADVDPRPYSFGASASRDDSSGDRSKTIP